MLRYLRNTFLEKYIKSNLFLLLFSDKIIENFKFLLPYENDWLFFKNYKINKKSIIIDIGAHWGESAITFRKFYPDNKIVSFEPNKDVFKKLKKNTKNLDIDIYNYGISNIKVSKLYFPYYKNQQLSLWGAVNLKKLKNRIKKYTYLNDNKINFKLIKCIFKKLPKFKNKIEIIKIDVEGHEHHVIKTLNKVILRDRPLFFIEHNLGNFRETFIFLKKRGYKCFYYSDGKIIQLKKMLYINNLLSKREKKTINIIFK